jgi:hypothetical protein
LKSIRLEIIFLKWKFYFQQYQYNEKTFNYPVGEITLLYNEPLDYQNRFLFCCFVDNSTEINEFSKSFCIWCEFIYFFLILNDFNENEWNEAHIIQATLLEEQNQLLRHVRVLDDLQVSNLTIIVAAAEGLPPRTHNG